MVLATASAALAACGGSAAGGGLGSTGRAQSPHAAPAAALQRAARAMQAAPSYTFTAVVDISSAEVRVSGEFQAPDRVHELVTAPTGSRAELVLVGAQTFVRTPATGVWRRSSSASTTTDPRTAFAVLLDAQNVTGSGSSYRFDLSPAATHRLVAGAAAPGPGSGVAGLIGGRVVSLHIDITAGGRPVTESLDYAAIGTAPPVTVPATTG